MKPRHVPPATPQPPIKRMYNPAPALPLCRHCTHAEPFGQGWRCQLRGTVSHFGCVSDFVRLTGVDDA